MVATLNESSLLSRRHDITFFNPCTPLLLQPPSASYISTAQPPSASYISTAQPPSAPSIAKIPLSLEFPGA